MWAVEKSFNIALGEDRFLYYVRLVQSFNKEYCIDFHRFEKAYIVLNNKSQIFLPISTPHTLPMLLEFTTEE